MTDFAAFRALFPALQHKVWLNAATLPPAARPVLEALRRVEGEWEQGEGSWQAWEEEADATREQFARLIGGQATGVALLPTVAEAAATVAASLPPGRVVVGEREFQSNLFPWLALRDRGFQVVEVPATDGVVSTEALVEAITEGTVLVTVSEVQSSNGYRVRIADVAERARAVEARLFVNGTQALGVLRFDQEAIRADYVACHGYKWLLAPRGTSWLHVREDRIDELAPLAPNWKSVERPYEEYYGGPLRMPQEARKLDISLAWFPWVGARAALGLILSLDPAAVEARCLALAAELREGLRGRGFRTVPQEEPTHIVALEVPDPVALRRGLLERRVVGAVRGGFVRLGFHAFNDETDVAAALDALGRG
ncbi:MAG: aminotransferase class V-fold PLP-dependent enzyme [Actinomycetota bacterium]